MGVVFVDFARKMEIDSQVPTITEKEMDLIKHRLDELDILIDESQTDQESFIYECEYDDIMASVNNSMQLVINRRKQRKLEGTRKKGQRPSLVSNKNKAKSMRKLG